MDEHRIANERLAVTIAALGAEPQSIRHATAGEVLWQAGPAWPKHAPLLFPIVGSLEGDAYHHDGETYALSRHGFARELDFTWVAREAASCTLMLADDAWTRTRYPFRFALVVDYALDGDALAVTYTLRNPGSVTLPASIGAHPAFRWPLADGAAKDAHALTFARDEPEPIRRLADGLLAADPRPTPVDGRVLRLRDELFVEDAIVFDRVRSTSVRYAAPGTPALDIAWTGFEQLGVWTKPGADFVCVEPWHGYSSPAGFDGDFADKPGLALIPPGGTATYGWRVAIEVRRLS